MKFKLQMDLLAAIIIIVLCLSICIGSGCNGNGTSIENDSDNTDDDDDVGKDDDNADDDDNNDDTADDDTTDDDTTDDDDDDDDDTTDDDDDDNDTMDQTQVVLDDGTSENGLVGLNNGFRLVQGFPVPNYPAKVIGFDYLVHAPDGMGNPVKVVIYYEGLYKSIPPTVPVYLSSNMVLTGPGTWETISLAGISELDNPIASGQLWIGFESTMDGQPGPLIGLDYQGIPPDDCWVWDLSSWINVQGLGYSGTLMIRPTLRHPPVSDDDDDDDSAN